MSEKKENLVSVIVPVYNVEDYLENCVESLLKQTYKNIEILLINDGSTDNSSKICDNYGKKDSRIKVYHKENEGVSKARNLGLECSTGDYIVFVDADDFVEKTYVEKLFNALINNKCDMSIVNIIEKYSNEKEIKLGYLSKQKLLNKREFLDHLYDKKSYKGGPCNKMYLKKIIRANNLFFRDDVYYGEDLFFVSQYADKCDKFYYECDEFLYFYNRIEGSATQTGFTKKKASFIKVCEELIDIFEKNGVDSSRIKQQYITFCYWSITFLEDSDICSKEEYKKICKKYIRDILKSKKITLFEKVKIVGMIYFPKVMKLLKQIRGR